jgi:hypothetical protein
VRRFGSSLASGSVRCSGRRVRGWDVIDAVSLSDRWRDIETAKQAMIVSAVMPLLVMTPPQPASVSA